MFGIFRETERITVYTDDDVFAIFKFLSLFNAQENSFALQISLRTTIITIKGQKSFRTDILSCPPKTVPDIKLEKEGVN